MQVPQSLHTSRSKPPRHEYEVSPAFGSGRSRVRSHNRTSDPQELPAPPARRAPRACRKALLAALPFGATADRSIPAEMHYIEAMSTPSIDDIADNFALLDDWEDRYRYLIELGRTLEPLAEADRTPEKKVQGCVSQVWVTTQWREGRAYFAGDSDAHIVKGLVGVLVALFSGKTAQEILAIDAWGFFRSLDLEAHLTPQRSNGLKSVVERIRSDARQALATA